MSDLAERVRANVAAIRERIARAAGRAGRNPAEIDLLPITKAVGPEETAALIEAGVTEVGENRVLDALEKSERMGPAAEKLRWQMVGHLQTNKVRKALTLFDGMHSLDSVRLAEAIEKEMAARRPDEDFPVYVEVNTTEEDAKTGASAEETREILSKLADCPHVIPVGLMTMGPLTGDAEKARGCFRRLRDLLAELRAADLAPEGCVSLSMGMSGDFEVAVEEGSSVVRVGTAVFAQG